MFLIVGLGNPGETYSQTRHNIGFMLVDRLAAQAGVHTWQSRSGCLMARANWQGVDVLFVKPLEFMNLSGNVVQQLLTFFKLPAQHLVVLFDDLDQESGAVRTRFGGGHGGHNGIRDILAKTGLDKFYRVKVGIGKPPDKGAVTNWVLGRFTQPEIEHLENVSFPEAEKRLLEILKQNAH